MTYLVNDPKEFAADAVRGMVAAFGDHVAPVHGGIVRATTSPDGQVSVVVGGGSGHYPAFPGWVGPGMAHGAVCGNVFASPSASQVESVVRAADNGGGTLLLFGNYAGDCLHFGEAASSLGADGLDVRVVTISDDVASNTPDHHGDRRGIAGDLLVVKVAGAAAEAGLRIDDVERVARRAGGLTRSLGVAFTGCTLPGADEPLFTVPAGQFALGLGIHGEPGISLHPMATAADIASLLVDRVLAEEPDRTEDGYRGRVAVLVNGLGATKYEELFVLFGSVAELLERRGLTIVHPVVGEQVTSLDMAGASLSVMFLDDELERLWLAPADTPAFKTGSVDVRERRHVRTDEVAGSIVPGSPESSDQARRALGLIEVLADVATRAEADLGRLDSVAGDGDHGQGMVLGATAAVRAAQDAVRAGAGMRTLFRTAGAAWSEGAGGTSGALWGAALRALGQTLSDAESADEERIGEAVVTAAWTFEEVGGAKPGDKTMVDATRPFAEVFDAHLRDGSTLACAWGEAAEAATSAAQRTAEIPARKGRARTHGDASLGHPDPGAVSFALLMTGVAQALGR
ncbi:dihydroxyacetone kinase family protein [Brooklawnia cerclae]|uniref:Dihydroxyacetone kinase n=1 Tax=Brooklawnia cerclae TaxID=349934 RepID=A0ABX0SGB4_9ACTN|nr:dihydroxyacetone kinase family protein [Brooklawnia cerclae]NIH57432.1 dihydroxyacetone kinase [Brooklawnia cerclae]